jgi:transposase
MLEELVMEASAAPAVPEASARDAEPSSPAVKAKRSARKPPPEHLPRRKVLHEPSCTCPSCGGEMRKVGEDVTEILDYVPGHFEVTGSAGVSPGRGCRAQRFSRQGR